VCNLGYWFVRSAKSPVCAAEASAAGTWKPGAAAMLGFSFALSTCSYDFLTARKEGPREMFTGL
jgi:hypothetical protein